jgi:hypothetical protein
MATDTQTKEDSLTRLKAIINNPRYHQFSDLTPEEEQFFGSIFIFNQGQFGPYIFDSPADVFSAFKEKPELLDVLFISPEDIYHNSEAIDQAILARLVSEHHLSQEQIEADFAKRNPKLTPKQIRFLTIIYLTNQARLTLDQIKQNPIDTHTTSTIISESNPKKDPHTTITELGTEIATITAAAAGIKITEEQAANFNNLLTASANLVKPPPQNPIRPYLETITSPDSNRSETTSAALSLIQALSITPQLTAQVFIGIRNTPIETTHKEQLVQALARSISPPTSPITTPEALVASIQQTPYISSIIDQLPPQTPVRQQLETIIDSRTSPLDQIVSAHALIETLNSSPGAKGELSEAIKNSNVPPSNQETLSRITNNQTITPVPTLLIATLQQTPGLADAINKLPPSTPTLEQLKTITNSQSPPEDQIITASTLIQSPENLASLKTAISESPLPQPTKTLLTETLDQSTHTPPTPNQVDVKTIITTLQNDPEIATSLQSITQPPSDTEITNPIDPLTLKTVLAFTIPEYQSPTADLARQVVASTDPIKTANLPETNFVSASTQTSFDPNIAMPSDSQIEHLETSFEQKLTTIEPDIKELTLRLIKETKATTTAVAKNPATIETIEQIAPTATPEFVAELVNAIRHDLPIIPISAFTDPHSAQAEAIATGLGHPDTAAGIKLHALVNPEDLKKAVDFAHAHPDSKLGKLLQDNPREFFFAFAKAEEVRDSALGKEIDTILNRPSPGSAQTPTTPTQLSPIQNIFKKVTEPFHRVTSFLNNKIPQIPGFGKYLNAITHPVQFIKNWIGKKIGENFVKQIGQRIGQAVLKRIGNEFAKKAIGTLLKEGLKKGMQLILKQAAIRGLQVAAQALNAIPGLGLLVAAAIEVGSFIIGKIKGVLDKLGMEIWGEKLKARDLGAAAGALIAAPVAVAVAIATAAVTTATTAIATTIIIAAAIGGFFYLSAVTIAPIIGSFAQLGLQTAGIGIGAGTYIPNANDTFNNSDNSAGACFTFSESVYPWSDQQKIMIKPLVSQIPSNYLSKLCSGGNIDLAYGGDNGSIGGFVQGNTISIYNAGFNFYTLAHETGHIFSHHFPGIYQDFASDTGVLSENAIDTYPIGSSVGDTEDFAETIAIYLTRPSYLSSKYPKHYNFIRNHVFN